MRWDNSAPMALLQISEPGQTPDPHSRRIAVGIDLGTTHSLVAAVRHGVSECLPSADGRVILPRVVRYLDPAEGGTAGQVITVWHDSGERALAGSSFGDWLTRWLQRTAA